MANDRLNYYEILQVTPHAAPEVIKAAHRALSKTMHPDAGGSTALAVAINEAIDVLSDPAKRQRYDLELRIGKAKTFAGGQPQVVEKVVERYVEKVVERYIAICGHCGAKNKLRDAEILNVKCGACGQTVAASTHFSNSDELRTETTMAAEKERPAFRFGAVAFLASYFLLVVFLFFVMWQVFISYQSFGQASPVHESQPKLEFIVPE